MPRRSAPIVITSSSSSEEDELDFPIAPGRKRRSQLSSSAGNHIASSSPSSSSSEDEWPVKQTPRRSTSSRHISESSSNSPSSSESENEVQIIGSSFASSVRSGQTPISRARRKPVKRRRVSDAKETSRELEQKSKKADARRSRKSALSKLVEKKQRRSGASSPVAVGIKYHDQSDDESINSYDDGSSDQFIVDGPVKHVNSSDEGSESGLEVNDPFQIDRIREMKAKSSPVSTPNSKRKIRVLSGSQKRLVHDSSDESDGADDEVPDSERSSYGNSDSSSDEDGFVQKNRDTRLAKNWKSELPVEFSFQSNQPLSEVFTVFVQMLASEIISPGFIKSCVKDQDTYFLGSLKRIDDIVESKKMSVVSSSAWKPHFKHDMETYPKLQYHAVQCDGDVCEACCRKNRFATYQLELSGPVYDRTYLNQLSKHSDNMKSGQKNRYLMGRFCMSRCYLYHRLHHYKFNLLESLRDEIDSIRVRLDTDDEEPILVAFMEKSAYINTIFHEFKTLDDEIKGFTLE